MGLFQNRRKPDPDTDEATVDDASHGLSADTLSTGIDLWNAAQEAFDEGHGADVMGQAADPDRRGGGTPIPPPPASVPAPPVADTHDPFSPTTPSVLDLISSPIGAAAEQRADLTGSPSQAPAPTPMTAFDLPLSRADAVEEPEFAGFDSDVPTRPSLDHGVVTEAEFIDLAELSTLGDAVRALSAAGPENDPHPASIPEEARPHDHSIGIPLDTEGLYEILEVGSKPSLAEVSAAHRAFLAGHDPADELDPEAAALLERIRCEVNAAYAMFRLTKAG